jgi:hypothetical protein
MQSISLQYRPNYRYLLTPWQLHSAQLQCRVTFVNQSQAKRIILSDKYRLPLPVGSSIVEASWNVMAHAQKPDFVFRRYGRVHLNRRRASVQLTIGSRVVGISGSNAAYTMFWGSVKSTGYPLHSPVSPPLPLPCVTVCHHISTGVY